MRNLARVIFMASVLVLTINAWGYGEDEEDEPPRRRRNRQREPDTVEEYDDRGRYQDDYEAQQNMQ